MNGMFSKIKEYWFILLLFIIVIIIFTFPLILNINHKIVGDGGDNYLNIIYHHIVANKLLQLKYPFSYEYTLRYPVGFDFSRGYDMPFFALFGGILRIFTNHVITYNITVLFGFLINCVCSFLLFHYLSKSKYVGMIGAIIFGLSFYTLSRGAGHIGHSLTGGFPLLIYSILKLKKTIRLRDFLLVAFAFILIFLSFIQFALLTLVLLCVNISLILVFYRTEFLSYLTIFNRNRKKIFITLIIMFSVITIFSYPFIKAIFNGSFADGNRKALSTENKIFLIEYFFPNPYSRTLISKITNSATPSSIENVVFIGWIEIALFICFLLFFPKSKTKKIVVFNVFVFFILSLGVKNPDFNINLPYKCLSSVFPFYYIPETGRYVVFISLFTSIASVLFLTRFKNNKALLITLLLLISIERLTSDYYLSPPLNNKFTQIVQSTTNKAVLDIPVSYSNSVYDSLAISYDKNIVSGYIHWSVDTPYSRSFIETNLKRFICAQNINNNLFSQFDKQQVENQDLISTLKKYGINTVVIHKNDLLDHAKYYFPECANVRIQTAMMFPQLFIAEPTKTQKIMSLFFPALKNNGDSIKFAQDGVFYFDGMHIFPKKWLPIKIYIDGTEMIFDTKWSDHGNENATTDPFIKLPVKNGSQIVFQFNKNHNTAYSFIKIWYRFIPPKQSKLIDQNQFLTTKIYEDDDAAVFIVK